MSPRVPPGVPHKRPGRKATVGADGSLSQRHPTEKLERWQAKAEKEGLDFSAWVRRTLDAATDPPPGFQWADALAVALAACVESIEGELHGVPWGAGPGQRDPVRARDRAAATLAAFASRRR